MTPYLFLDLETAGLAHDAPIFEVACILTRFTDAFHELDRYRAAVRWHDSFDDVLETFARDMHETSGLLAEMRERGLALTLIDSVIATMLDDHLPASSKGRVHLAGSGVSHFDLRRVQDQMPKTAAWLHWRPLDVGQLEEWRKLTGRHRTYDEAHPNEAKRKTHRAMDDIAYHLDEANWYLEEMR